VSDERAELAEIRGLLFGFGQVTSSNVRELLSLLADAGHADARVEMHPDGVRVVKLKHSLSECESATIQVAWSDGSVESHGKGVMDIGNQRCPTCNGTGHVGYR
jgi:hypothetical protein